MVEDLRKIGIVRYILAPNKCHHLYFLPFLHAYPSAEGFIADSLESKRPDLSRFALVPREAPWSSEIQGFFIDACPV